MRLDSDRLVKASFIAMKSELPFGNEKKKKKPNTQPYSITKPLRHHEQACKNSPRTSRHKPNTHQKDFRKQSLRTQKETVYQRTIFIMLLSRFIRAGRNLKWRQATEDFCAHLN